MASDRAPEQPVATSEVFECKMCSACCRGFGGTLVSADDVVRIAGYVGADPARFVEEYCQMSGNKPVLAQGKNGYCVFWDGLCAIHPVKPRMCRAWPFIRPVLVDVINWRSMAGSCPGMRTDVPDEVIRACVKKALLEAE